MATSRSELKTEKHVKKSSSSQSDTLRYESKEDPKVALQTALTSTLPTMPVPLCGVISDYLLSKNMKKCVNDYKEDKLKPAALGKELLEAFSYPDSGVAFALDDLAHEERARLLAHSDFPMALKLYYFLEEEFKRAIEKEPEIKLALLFGLYNQGLGSIKDKCLLEMEPEIKSVLINGLYTRLNEHLIPYEILLSRNADEFKKDPVRFLASKVAYNRLFSDKPQELIHNLKIKFTCFKTGPYSSYCDVLIRQSVPHLNLPYADVNQISFNFNNATLLGANLKGSKLPGNLINVDLRGADLRGAILSYTIINVDLRNTQLTGATFHPVETCRPRGTDLLGVPLDKYLKEAIQRSMDNLDLTEECAHFWPIRVYFSQILGSGSIFSRKPPRPKLEECIHGLRVMKAKTKEEFELLRSEIPETLTRVGKPGLFQKRAKPNLFNEALKKVSKNFPTVPLTKTPSKKPGSSS